MTPTVTLSNGARRALLLAPALIFLAVFFVMPLVDNSARSFIGEGGFTLSRYADFLTDSFYLGVIAETVILSAAVTLISVLIAYPVAYVLVRKAGRFSGLMIFFLIAPLLTSIIMRTFGWQVLFARRGLVNQWLVNDLGLLDAPLRWLNTPGLAIAALVHVLVPFAVLSIASVLQGVDRRLEEGALMLGASRIRTFFEVTLPLTVDGIGTGLNRNQAASMTWGWAVPVVSVSNSRADIQESLTDKAVMVVHVPGFAYTGLRRNPSGVPQRLVRSSQ